MTIGRLIIFCILMENNQGIMGKSPSYILEKFETCKKGTKPEGILDDANLEKYKSYLKKWHKGEE